MTRPRPRLVVATRNRSKLAELRRILREHLDVELLDLNDVPAYPEIPETGATFAENALAKARQAVRHTGLAAVADDSGLTVDALNGMPDVLSARWAGRARSDEANLRLVLEQLADVPDDGLHRKREEHDADDQREVRIGVDVAGERHTFRALELAEHPLAADREEVEVGEPERGGDEEPEDRCDHLTRPDPALDRDVAVGDPGLLRRGFDVTSQRLAGILMVGAVVDDHRHALAS